MTKKKGIKEVKAKPIIFSDFYDWCEMNGEALLFILFVLGVVSMICLSIPDKNDVILSDNGNWWYVGLLFICLSELLFVWIVNNVGANTDDLSEIAVSKFIAVIYSIPLTLILVAGGLTIIAYGLKILLAITTAIGVLFAIGIIGYGYLKLNQWLARKVQ